MFTPPALRLQGYGAIFLALLHQQLMLTTSPPICIFGFSEIDPHFYKSVRRPNYSVPVTISRATSNYWNAVDFTHPSAFTQGADISALPISTYDIEALALDDNELLRAELDPNQFFVEINGKEILWHVERSVHYAMHLEGRKDSPVPDVWGARLVWAYL